MTTRVTVILCIILVCGLTAYTAWIYHLLPDTLPIHWNVLGKVDGTAGKGSGAWAGVIVAALTCGGMLGLPIWSAKRFATEQVHHTYNYVAFVVVLYLVFLQIVILNASLQPNWDVSKIVAASACMLLGLLGNVLGQVRRNFWMGVRTKWSLANELVWMATNRLAARLLTGAGFLCAILICFGMPPLIFVLVLVVVSVISVWYSYSVYQRIEKG